MDELQPSLQASQADQKDLLYFWALGDLHYYMHPAWQAIHSPRMNEMFQDLRQLWASEGAPTFCVSPGDLIEFAAPENYQLARQELTRNLDTVPFYPGLGNHEMLTHSQEEEASLLEDFTLFWQKPLRYYWVEGETLCVMLDVIGYAEPFLTREALEFLEIALAKHPRHRAVIFAHCPLYKTVLSRDPAEERDYSSLAPFFSLSNSDEVRALFARHANTCLYISGHTHSGWQTPGLVSTEDAGGHPMTYVNLSSPWYTGMHHGIAWSEDGKKCVYRPDDPDVVASMAIRISRTQISVRLRDHRAGNWLAQWDVSLK